MTRKDIYRQAIKKYGRILQTIVAIEEMAELQKELSKALRSKENYSGIVEEIADVQIMLEQLKIIFDISEEEIDKQMTFKLQRLQKNLSLKEG